MVKIEDVGKIAAAGWGDRVLIGVIAGLLKNISPERCYEYIRDDKALLHWATESQWRRFRRMASAANVRDITTSQVIEFLKDERPELLGVIINHPKGRGWLDNQVAELKKKLTS